MKRKSYSPKFKARLAVEAIREQKTFNEIAGKHEINPKQITRLRKRALDKLPEIFSKNRKNEKSVDGNLIDRLHQQIGKLQFGQSSRVCFKSLDKWAYEKRVALDFSRPGKPMDNAYIESFSGTLKHECLNTH